MIVAGYLLVSLLSSAVGDAFSSGPVSLHTVLETNKQVVFSGKEHGEFQLKIRNSGLVPVLVTERQADGVLQERGRFKPRKGGILHFTTGSAAIVRSLDIRQAEFEVKFFNKGFDGVNIRYESANRQ